MVSFILQGQFFINYAFGGDGPLFSYIAAFVSLPFGLSFYSLKLTSVLIGTLLIPISYRLADAVIPKKPSIALISAFLAAVSFWDLTFARQAKPYILVPVIAGLVAVALVKKKRISAGVLIGLGMYSQAAFWGIFLLAFTHWKTFMTAIMISAPFWFTVYSGSTPIFGQSYIGEKFGQQSLPTKINALSRNVLVSTRALWFQGDGTFRHNVPLRPHLDFVSGSFLVIGIFSISRMVVKKSLLKSTCFIIFISFVTFQASSWLDLANTNSVPNAGRSLGIVPLLHLCTAIGISLVFRIKKSPIWGTKALIGIILTLVLYLNYSDYFFQYPQTLPNQNVPFGKQLANFINEKIPPEQNVVMAHCCWGEWGQPEPNGIRFRLLHKEQLYDYAWDVDFVSKLERDIPSGSWVTLIADPDGSTREELENLVINPQSSLHYEANLPIAWIIAGQLKTIK